MKCPNCDQPVKNHPENGCVLAALIGVLRERGTLDEVTIDQIHANCDVDSFWMAAGQLVDRLENKEFSK
jgi:hypothetical protein